MSHRGAPVPLCKSAGTKELKVVHGASATCVLQNVDSLLTTSISSRFARGRGFSERVIITSGSVDVVSSRSSGHRSCP